MKIVGHRGARGLAPENTLKSFRKALSYHVDEIECDVRVTKDGVPVLHHDHHLNTPAGDKLKIRSYKYAHLKQHDSDLTTLDEALAYIPESTSLQIEIKPGEPAAVILKVIKSALENSRQSTSLLIGSKSQKILKKMHAELPDIAKVVIHPWSGVIATRRAKQVNTKRISMNQLFLWSGFVRLMARDGWLLYAYTVNNPKRAKYLEKCGASGVFTDYPDRFST